MGVSSRLFRDFFSSREYLSRRDGQRLSYACKNLHLNKEKKKALLAQRPHGEKA